MNSSNVSIQGVAKWIAVASATLTLALAGCGSGFHLSSTSSPVAAITLAGRVHGGQQPVSGATIQLFAVAPAGSNTSILLNTQPVTTDASGSFGLTGLYTCPSATTNVYMTATGGNPGFAGSQNNPALGLMVALGHCGNLTPNTFISINEVTTVAAVYALAPYMQSYQSVNAGASDSAFALASALADSSSGVTPGAPVAGVTVPATKVRTLANIISSCVNSNGTDGICNQLFTLTSSNNAPLPADTIGALLGIANNPTQNVMSLYTLTPPIQPFQPTMTSAPSDWTLPTLPAGPALAIASAALPVPVTGVAYSAALQAQGGTPSYTWSIKGGDLPSGLTLTPATGIISGIPNSSGTFAFTVQVVDKSSPGQTAAVPFAITAIPGAPALSVSGTLPAGTAGAAYSAGLSAAGGTPSYTWTLQNGSLPAGLSLSANTGMISGMPNTAGTFNFTLGTTDSANPVQAALSTVSLTIAKATSVLNGSQTWYVRPDGGTRYSSRVPDGQCDGLADVAYPGHGVNQHCGFNDYRYLYDDKSYSNSAWVIAGGDTVILRGGPYRVGFDQSGSNDPWCFGGNGPAACTNPVIPAGTKDFPTRILGENYASCGTATTTDRSKLTQIFGGHGVNSALNLRGAQYVQIECIDLTTHGECTQHGLYKGNSFPAGCSTSFPVSDFAPNGIYTDTSTHDILLQDMWIHSFTTRGVIGPIGGLLTATRTTLSYNGFTGWDFDDGNATASTNNATWTGSYVTIEYSGCLAEYPIVHNVPIIACYDDINGGQGDGVGTPPTKLNFSCDHCDFHYNTQDGADFGHVSMSQASFTNSIAYGNMGGTFKSGPNVSLTMINNISINNCLRMSQPLGDAPATFNQALGDFCRAAGDGVSFNFPSGTQASAVLQSNTFMGYGANMVDVQCQIPPGGATASPSTCPRTFTFQNNIVFGMNEASYNQGSAPSMWNSILPSTQSNNVFWGMRSNPAGSSDIAADPAFLNNPASPLTSETVLDGFIPYLAQGSPAVAAGMSTGLMKDYFGNSRSLFTPSIGAIESSGK